MVSERLRSWPVGPPYCFRCYSVFGTPRGVPLNFLLAAPLPPFQAPRGPFAAPLPPFRGLVAALHRPRRRPFSGPVAALLAAPSPPFRGPVAALQLTRRAPRGKRRAFPHPLSLQPPLTYPPRHMVAALWLSTRPPPPPLSPCSRGGEGMGVAGVGALGHLLPFPSSSFRSHCCSCRWGEGVRVWGRRGSGTGVAGVRQPAAVPPPLLSFPLPSAAPAAVWGEGKEEGEAMEGVTS
ncbi:unnamed protein product [Closterium sp. NIES-54]